MKPLDLNELRSLYAASTPGKWESVLGYCGSRVKRFLKRDAMSDGLLIGYDADCNFIAAAHNAMPALLDLIDEQQKRIVELGSYKADETTRRAKADAYDRICQHLGVTSNVLRRIAELEAALKAFADMWGSADAHSASKRAQAKRAAMWELYEKAMSAKDQNHAAF